ncbi:MAG: Aminopeptidase family protein [Bacteroidetes bacterium]|nr:Aminopeptidase family protein [Bacteroidota bacterium]
MTRHRIRRLRHQLLARGLDGLIVSSIFNVRYLTNFSGSNALCIVRKNSALFLTDQRYLLQSKVEVKGLRRVIAAGSLSEEAAKRNALADCKTIGFESHSVTYAQYRGLKKLFPSVSFVPTSDLVENLALVKDEEELNAIRSAVTISDKVFHQLLSGIRPGLQESDVAAEISYLHRKFGAEKDAFEPIVASGERGSLPHARATTKRIRSGEMVTLDFGCTVRGYNSDLTRTIGVGRVSGRAKEMYDAVLHAQTEAVAAARGGMMARDLDAVARRSITRAGYGKHFSHSLGHGLGLQVHERPRVSSRSTEELQAGSVVTIEPGIYIGGFGGVRIEDDVLLTRVGCEVLNTAPKKLMIV